LKKAAYVAVAWCSVVNPECDGMTKFKLVRRSAFVIGIERPVSAEGNSTEPGGMKRSELVAAEAF
jgi:hypothetical protein